MVGQFRSNINQVACSLDILEVAIGGHLRHFHRLYRRHGESDCGSQSTGSRFQHHFQRNGWSNGGHNYGWSPFDGCARRYRTCQWDRIHSERDPFVHFKSVYPMPWSNCMSIY